MHICFCKCICIYISIWQALVLRLVSRFVSLRVANLRCALVGLCVSGTLKCHLASCICGNVANILRSCCCGQCFVARQQHQQQQRRRIGFNFSKKWKEFFKHLCILLLTAVVLLFLLFTARCNLTFAFRGNTSKDLNWAEPSQTKWAAWPVKLARKSPGWLMVKMSGKQNKAFHLANSGWQSKGKKNAQPRAQTSRKLLLLMLWQLFVHVFAFVCCTMHSSHAHEHAHAEALRHHKSTTTTTTTTTTE